MNRRSPMIGEHTVEVMERVLGLEHQELVEGFEDGTFWPAEFPRYPHIEEALANPVAVSGNGASPAAPDPWKPATPGIGPLDGVRVLELADEKGQFCGKLMGDLGADVIKIEPPGGDDARSMGPFLDDVPNRDRSLYFWHYNTSKRGVTLNLETADGRELFQKAGGFR